MVQLDSLEWSETQLKQGQIVKLKEIPFKVRLFKLVVTNGNTFWVITNDLELDNAQVIQAANDVGWQIEQMHRELKQLVGLEQCQCRKVRSQRDHIACCCYQAWLAIKVKAKALGKTLYQVINSL